MVEPSVNGLRTLPKPVRTCKLVRELLECAGFDEAIVYRDDDDRYRSAAHHAKFRCKRNDGAGRKLLSVEQASRE